MIKSPNGKRMYNMVLQFHNNDEYQLSIYEANGRIMDSLDASVDKVVIANDVTKATWSLYILEWLYQIPTKPNDSDTERRRRIIQKMNEFFPVTKWRMKQLIQAYTDGVVDIDDERGDYIFEVIIEAATYIDTKSIIETIEETKPAHLDYKFKTTELDAVTIAGVAKYGESVVLYPQPIQSQTLESDVSIAGAMYTNDKMEIKESYDD